MAKIIKRNWTVCLLVFLMAGITMGSGSCARDNTAPVKETKALSVEGGAPEQEAIVCKAPRPEMCTREYRPVCGLFADGTFKTFGNACTACSNENVVRYIPGPCPK